MQLMVYTKPCQVAALDSGTDFWSRAASSSSDTRILIVDIRLSQFRSNSLVGSPEYRLVLNV